MPMTTKERLLFAVSQRDRYFATMQTCYDLAKRCGDILNAVDVASPDISIVELFTSRMSNIQRTYDAFESTIAAIEELNIKVEEKDRIPVLSTIKSFDELYYYCLSISTKIEDSRKPRSSTPLDSSGSSCKHSSIKLPRINIPVFTGRVEDWFSFHSLYLSTVHDNNSLSPSEKFQYLKSYLAEEPLSLISHLHINDANYPIAWECITTKYQNKRLLAAHYIDAMLSFRPLTEANHASLSSFLRVFKTNVNALGVLQIKRIDDVLLLHLATRNLDPVTRRDFENSVADKDMPSFTDLTTFIEEQCKVHQLTDPTKSRPSKNTKSGAPNSQTKGNQSSHVNATTSVPNNERPCPSCAEYTHKIYGCDKFKSLSVDDRSNFIKNSHLCRNCLGFHYVKSCKSVSKCPHCSEDERAKDRHHTLLHKFNDSSIEDTSNTSSSVNTFGNYHQRPQSLNVILSTAVVAISNGKGEPCRARILVDPGSQLSLITASLARKLGLTIHKSSHDLKGVGGHVQNSDGYVSCVIRPSDSATPAFETNAYVIDKVTDNQPQAPLDPTVLQSFAGIKLADPHFITPGEIEFLLGADLYPLILNSSHNIIHGEPSAISTCFGWIIVGRALINQSISHSTAQPTVAVASSTILTTCCEKLNSSLKTFWESEEVIAPKIPANPDDDLCEELFVRTHSRLPCGKYMVRLPFKDKVNPPKGRDLALKRFKSFEARLNRNLSLSKEYHAFMQEYISLGHMYLASTSSDYIIPHHVVQKRDSSTTKVRTVFDASFRPQPDGPSLNSLLMTGPKLQRDITDIISGFRLTKYVICADVKMMYRMTFVHPDDRVHQHIFYRNSPAEAVREYELATVTYGMRPSAFLAQRALLQLVNDEGDPYPLASHAIRNQLFVDDFCCGTDTFDSALRLREELIQLLAKGGMQLRKWCSNHPALLEGIPVEHRTAPLSFSPADDFGLKILGLNYDPNCDSFSYNVAPNSIRPTKRAVSSEIAKIYDPLGWLTPITFTAKCLLQLLWKRKVDWDEILPSDLQEVWEGFSNTLPTLRDVRIPRLIPVSDSIVRIFGFCDGSEKGYAAVLYIATTKNDSTTSHLVKAKSKVAPLKPLTVPRLELSGAVLLAHLIKSIQPMMTQMNVVDVFLFSDSTIALSWIRTPPHALKTFVANRVVEILRYSTIEQWHHIRTNENPADPASRGLQTSELLDCELWWKGPEFIRKSFTVPRDPNGSNQEPAYIEELKTPSSNTLTSSHHIQPLVEIFGRSSSYLKLIRMVAHILRFINNRIGSGSHRQVGPLTPAELKNATTRLIGIYQRHHFSKDMKAIVSGEAATSRELSSLSPFIDNDGVLRVGGRIDRANLPFSVKHPVIIPHNSHLAKLICNYFHTYTMHGGTRLCCSLIQRQFWIPYLRKLMRLTTYKCLKCYLPRAKPLQPIMSDLPAVRLSSLRPFNKVSIDFAGPFTIKATTRRNASTSKSYLAVFVCMQVKAVHLDLVPDLSSTAFLRSLDRFIARRGICNEILSDNGTNFVGANRQLSEVYSMLSSSSTEIQDHLSSRHIKWSFHPPNAPHFNGIAEACVKSAKHHLLRVVGSQVFTYEELLTIIIRVESVLNSRPLGVMTSDHRDPDYLTPGHFITGSPLLSAPEEDVTQININRLDRYQLLMQAVQSLWKRWVAEYIPTLIPRSKWQEVQNNITTGAVVFIRKHHTMPLQWPVGVIEEIFPGKDAMVRVARVRTSTGTYIRPVHNLIPLPAAE